MQLAQRLGTGCTADGNTFTRASAGACAVYRHCIVVLFGNQQEIDFVTAVGAKDPGQGARPSGLTSKARKGMLVFVAHHHQSRDKGECGERQRSTSYGRFTAVHTYWHVGVHTLGFCVGSWSVPNSRPVHTV